jgi:inosine-uridine nucleoside N-ribohydrolase
LAIAHLIKPEVIKTRNLNVEIETEGDLTRGRTVADIYGVTGRSANTDVAMEVNNSLFKELLFQAIKALDIQ